MIDRPPLAFAHIGDLHLTDAKQRNFADLLAIAAQIEMDCSALLDFVVLPGDNADNGMPAQYKLTATALKMLSPPVHAIPGDHDMEQGGLDHFHAGLGAGPLPKAFETRGVRCFFLDVVGHGSGGPDFRLGIDQGEWLERQLADARTQGAASLIFMHTYPDDLKGTGEAAFLTGLIGAHDVALVDMGHTHYNELANDGRTIYAATRSTAQIEEGPPGYSIATFDDGIVSWRFKPLDDGFPFVVITAPADHRLIRRSTQDASGRRSVRAMVFGQRRVAHVACRIDDGAWTAMRLSEDGRVWSAETEFPSIPVCNLTVRARDEAGRLGEHRLQPASPAFVPPPRQRRGSDADSIGAWPENGILGTQIGPNRNGGPL